MRYAMQCGGAKAEERRELPDRPTDRPFQQQQQQQQQLKQPPLCSVFAVRLFSPPSFLDRRPPSVASRRVASRPSGRPSLSARLVLRPAQLLLRAIAHRHSSLRSFARSLARSLDVYSGRSLALPRIAWPKPLHYEFVTHHIHIFDCFEASHSSIPLAGSLQSVSTEGNSVCVCVRESLKTGIERDDDGAAASLSHSQLRLPDFPADRPTDRPNELAAAGQEALHEDLKVPNPIGCLRVAILIE